MRYYLNPKLSKNPSVTMVVRMPKSLCVCDVAVPVDLGFTVRGRELEWVRRCRQILVVVATPEV